MHATVRSVLFAMWFAPNRRQEAFTAQEQCRYQQRLGLILEINSGCRRKLSAARQFLACPTSSLFAGVALTTASNGQFVRCSIPAQAKGLESAGLRRTASWRGQEGRAYLCLFLWLHTRPRATTRTIGRRLCTTKGSFFWRSARLLPVTPKQG